MVSLNQNAVGVDFATHETAPTFALGTVVRGSDGHDYIFAKASGAIADAATAVLTEAGFTMASGAGSWTNNTGSAFAANEYGWFQKTAI